MPSVRIAIIATLIATTAAFAQSNNALDFDGIDDTVIMGDPIDPTGPFTVEAWILARSGVDGGRFLSTRSGSGGYEMDINEFEGNLTLRFTFVGSVRAAADFGPYMNTWTHVAGTWEGPGSGGVDLYINGAPAGSGIYATPLPASGTAFRLGSRVGALSGFFDGRVDEVRVWSAKLDQGTIASWMNSHVTASHPNFGALDASWRLDEGTGQSVASEVNDGVVGGTLGASAGVGADDPTWVSSDVVPSRPTSVSELKSRYQRGP